MSPSASARRRAAIAALAALAACGTPACTESTDEFCASLSERFALDDLSQAISMRDQPRITAGLADLRELERTAPEELLVDIREVLDTTSETVQAVTDASESGDDGAPVDLTALNDRLAKVEPAAQRIVAFADRNCGIDL